MHKLRKLLSLFPKVLTCLILIWTGVSTIIDVFIVSKIVVLFIIGILFVASIFTYFKIIVLGAGSPTDFPDLHLKNVQAADEGQEFPPEYLVEHSITLKTNGRFRFCRACAVWKPDRCHHCSSCNKCILKMDHHCPWFAACIGFRNQKLFVQFLIYATFYALAVFCLNGIQLLWWFRTKQYVRETIKISLLVVWLFSVIVLISMLAFTSYTIYLVCKNETTIEMYEWSNYKDRMQIYNDSTRMDLTYQENRFDLGSRRANWESVMGQSWIEWLFPIITRAQYRCRHTLDEKGLYFKVGAPLSQEIHDSMVLQANLMRRLTPKSSFDLPRDNTTIF
ncbi:LAMI_0C00584g1_1 [Lachancea mirantina]|uniref:Palmitoyltransferase n=1 Tax=Lachancea mirantina TaxID=1230905 RepID=A0A1G4IZJ8_9SACH|nr:LAMI_0C00584g1_1 [Lachancea mirantina]